MEDGSEPPPVMPDAPPTFTLATWKEQVQERLLAAATQLRSWIDTAKEHSVTSFLYAAALTPVFQAAQANLADAMGAVASIGSGVLAARLVAYLNQDDAPAQLAAAAADDDDLRAALDELLLEHLEALPALQKGLGDDDRAWFKETLREELQALGTWDRYEAHLSQFTGAIAQGPGSTAQYAARDLINRQYLE